MAIPVTPLVVKFDPNELTLDELCLFEPDSFTASGLRGFLVAHTNWTKKQIGAVTMAELKEVVEQLTEKIKEAAVPLVQAPA